jgi:peptidylprolyl isomerase
MAQARTGNHVTVSFTGRLDDGTIFASSQNSEPIEFTLGDEVAGMEPGETKTVHISADDAFGPWREELMREIPRENLPDTIDLAIGQQFWVEQPGAQPVLMSVVDLSDFTVTLDANHPLAGQDLIFDLELVDVS